MGVGSVYAATLIRPLTQKLEASEVSQPAEAPTSPPRTVSRPRTVGALEGGAAQKEEVRPETEMPHAASPAPSVTLREQPARSPAPVSSADQWKRAAQALRDGDYQSADAALQELTRGGTDADRESALLVQAQVLLAQGREREAKSLLKTLEGSARAPSVRRKSVELLARLRDRPSPRPGKARVATEPP